MKKIALAFLFISSSLQASLPHDLLIPPDLGSREEILPVEGLNSAQVNQDMKVLIHAFRNGYGGYEKFQIQFETEVFPSFLRLKGKSSKGLCSSVGAILDQINDKHLSVRVAGAQSSCSLLPPPRGRVGSNFQTDLSRPWSFRERVTKSGKRVSFFSVARSPIRVSSSWDGFLDQARLAKKNSDALIIDLRGNEGGDDGAIENFAKIIYGLDGTEVSLAPAGTIVRRQTPESYAMFSNLFLLQILSQRWKGLPESSDLEKYYQLFLKHFEIALTGELSPLGLTQKKASRLDLSNSFKGPVRLLVDGRCASSCESGLEFFENLPTAKSVGENSAGLVHFGNVGTLVLKNSRLILGIPTQAYFFEDDRFVERVGYKPDIFVAPGKDAMDAALHSLEMNIKTQDLDFYHQNTRKQ